MIRWDLFDSSYACIVVKKTITVEGFADANRRNKKLTFKNNSMLRSCMSKINNTFLNNAEDHDIAMPRTIILWPQEVCAIIREKK